MYEYRYCSTVLAIFYIILVYHFLRFLPSNLISSVITNGTLQRTRISLQQLISYEYLIKRRITRRDTPYKPTPYKWSIYRYNTQMCTYARYTNTIPNWRTRLHFQIRRTIPHDRTLTYGGIYRSGFHPITEILAQQFRFLELEISLENAPHLSPVL